MQASRAEAARVGSGHGPGLVAFVMLFCLGVGFGLNIPLNRFATTNGVPFIPYVFWQSLGGAVILFVIAAAARRMPRFDWAHLRLYAAIALLNVVFPLTALTYVAPHAPVGLISIGMTLVPMLIYAMALGLRLDRYEHLRFLGIVLGLAGVLLVLLPRASLPDPEVAGWLAISLVAPLCFALRAVVIPLMRPPTTSSLPLALGMLIVATIMMLIIALASGQWWAFDAPWGAGHWGTLAAMVQIAGVFYLIFEVIRRGGPVFFAGTNYIAVLVGVAVGVAAFGDRHSAWIWGALALVVLGLFLVNRRAPAARASNG